MAPSEKYELFVQVLTQQSTQREAADKFGVDRSTVVHVCKTAKQGALDALAASVPGRAASCATRSQAIVGFVVYLFVLGPILSGVHATSEVAEYLPYQAGNALGRLTSSVDAAMLGQASGGWRCSPGRSPSAAQRLW